MVSTCDSPDAGLIEDEQLRVLQRAVLTLRAEEQEVFLLRQNGSLTYEQIAEATSLPLGLPQTFMPSNTLIGALIGGGALAAILYGLKLKFKLSNGFVVATAIPGIILLLMQPGGSAALLAINVAVQHDDDRSVGVAVPASAFDEAARRLVLTPGSRPAMH